MIAKASPTVSLRSPASKESRVQLDSFIADDQEVHRRGSLSLSHRLLRQDPLGNAGMCAFTISRFGGS